MTLFPTHPVALVTCLALALAWSPASRGAEDQEGRDALRQAFVGDWQLLDAASQRFLLHLHPDQTVNTSALDGTKRGGDEEGTWSWQDGRVIVTYRSGWVLALVAEDRWVYGQVYEPGRPLTSVPGRMAPAFKVVPPDENPQEIASIFGHSYVQWPVY